MLLGANFFKVARAMKPTFRSAYRFPRVRDLDLLHFCVTFFSPTPCKTNKFQKEDIYKIFRGENIKIKVYNGRIKQD